MNEELQETDLQDIKLKSGKNPLPIPQLLFVESERQKIKNTENYV